MFEITLNDKEGKEFSTFICKNFLEVSNHIHSYFNEIGNDGYVGEIRLRQFNDYISRDDVGETFVFRKYSNGEKFAFHNTLFLDFIDETGCTIRDILYYWKQQQIKYGYDEKARFKKNR